MAAIEELDAEEAALADHTVITPQEAAEAAAWRPAPRGVAARAAVLAGLVLLILAVPQLVPSIYTNLISRAAVYGLIALSLNVIVGYTGQVSLGHSAFVGVGAFGAGYALTVMKLPYAGAIVLAALTGVAGALLIGAIALRLAGLYLALVTIAYALFAQETLFNVRSLTGGGAGQPAPRPSMFSTDVAFAYFCIAVLALALAFDWRLTASKGGRAIEALRDDERVAASWGINVTSFKLLAFVISGILAGVAGALFAGIEQLASRQDFTFLPFALTFLVMTVVGGAGNRWGVVQGGVLFAILPTLLDRAHENFHVFPFTAMKVTWEPAIGALLLLVTLIFSPGGIAQQQRHLLSWLSFKRFNEPDHGGGISRGGTGARP
ncbi:MAG: branched-chain amino acid ABC transporter permease [Actinobacteria bacterium]|nr:branched-chain amino acid ABC transporter permease [Actinomycetota bacterium]